MLGYQDAQVQFENTFPGFVEACQPFVIFVQKLTQVPSELTHLSAVANQCGVAWDVYVASVLLVMKGFPVPAMVLCRNLFEITAGALYLIRHPEKLADFLDAGELLPLELLMNAGQISAMPESRIQAT